MKLFTCSQLNVLPFWPRRNGVGRDGVGWDGVDWDGVDWAGLQELCDVLF